jgi:hypothetical protein
VTIDDEEERAAMFADRVAEQDERFPGYGVTWARLTEAVLAHGGGLVVPPLNPDPLAELVGEHGRLWTSGARLVPGPPSMCHQNAVSLWRDGAAAAIGTGYALSDDGLWRGHSWGFGSDGTLVETTEPRLAYFGVRLADEMAERFADLIEGTMP